MLEIERTPILNNTQDLLDYRAKMIENLQKEIQEAGNLCWEMKQEMAVLREEKEQLQEKCSVLLDKQVQDDYKFQNSKKMFENVNKTLERYEAENKALRTLVNLWI